MRKNLGKYLKKELEMRGWRQCELARRSGLSEAAISLYINGINTPTNYKAIKGLCNALKTTPDKLFGYKKGRK